MIMKIQSETVKKNIVLRLKIMENHQMKDILMEAIQNLREGREIYPHLYILSALTQETVNNRRHHVTACLEHCQFTVVK